MPVMHEEHQEYEALLRVKNGVVLTEEEAKWITDTSDDRFEELEDYLDKHDYCECGEPM